MPNRRPAWLAAAFTLALAVNAVSQAAAQSAGTPANSDAGPSASAADAPGDGSTLVPSTVDFLFEKPSGSKSWTESIPDLHDPERMHEMRVTVVPFAFSVEAAFADRTGTYRQFMRIVGDRLVIWQGLEAPDDGGAVPLEVYAAGNVRVTIERERVDGGPLSPQDEVLSRSVLRLEQIFFSLSDARGMGSRISLNLHRVDQVDLYVRARELRMLSLSDAVAEDASISLTPYVLPQLYLKADLVRFRHRRHVRVVDVLGTRVMHRDRQVVPFFNQSHNLSRTGFIRRASIEESDRFGFAVDVDLDLWLLWHDTIMGRQWEDTVVGRVTGGAAYYSERGVAPRIQGLWRNRETRGGVSAFYIHDSGDDTAFGRNAGFFPLENRDRFRFRAWHQQEFPLDLRLSAHLSVFSDRNLLVEFFNEQFERQENQHTYIELTRYDSLSGLRVFFRPQINPHDPTIEYKPRVQFFIYPSRLFNLPGLGTPVYVQLRTDVAHITDRPAAGSGEARVTSTRLDLAPSIVAPIDAGLFGFSQKLTMQTSWYGWDLDLRDVTLPQRVVFESETRLYTNVFRTFAASSRVFDISGLRHTVRPELVYLHRFPVTYRRGTSADSIPQFDEIDVPVGVFDALTLSVTNVLEGLRARRRRDGGEGVPRVVDVLTMRAEMSFFPRPGRDNDGYYWGPLVSTMELRPQDWIRFTADIRYSFASSAMTRYGIGGTLLIRTSERSAGARAASRLGLDELRTILEFDIRHRVVRHTSAISRLGLRWLPSAAYHVAIAVEYDFENEVIRNTNIALQRRFQEFSLTFRVQRDFVRDDTSLFLSFDPLGFGTEPDLFPNE